MVIEIRPCRTPEEVKQYDAMGAYVFADPPIGEPIVPTSADWTLCAFDDGKVVSTMGAFPFTARLNGAPVRMAGVTMVGTLPGYRRRGLLRQIMSRGFRDMRERGQSIAILWASMAAIYQRFGYGIGSDYVRYGFDPRAAAMREPWTGDGLVSIESAEDAFPAIKQLYIEYASPRNLYLHRSTALWQADTLKASVKDHPVHVAVYRDAEGAPRGHLVFQLHHWPEARFPGPSQELLVKDFIALDTDAYRALWDFILKHDLVARVSFAGHVGLDDLAPDLLLEPRMLDRRVSDGIWLRVVDIEKALEARPYGDRGELTLALDDTMCPWNTGTWLLETDGPTAHLRAIERAADITVTPNALASLLAGSRTATQLARLGSVSGGEAALRCADRLFRTEYVPNCPNNF